MDILRKAALLLVLAQIGSFVPAELMRFVLTDCIFTRIGASDFLAINRKTSLEVVNWVAAKQKTTS